MTDIRSRKQYDVIELERATQPATLADTFNPSMRMLEVERQQRVPGQRTDLRRLSAWIKMTRALEEAKKHRNED
jgi:hypothetical protein